MFPLTVRYAAVGRRRRSRYPNAQTTFRSAVSCSAQAFYINAAADQSSPFDDREPALAPENEPEIKHYRRRRMQAAANNASPARPRVPGSGTDLWGVPEK